MKKEALKNRLIQVQDYYKQEDKEHYLVICEEEHLKNFTNNLESYFKSKNFIKKFNTPNFEEEEKVDRQLSYNNFLFLKDEENISEIAKQLEKAKVEDFLIVLGQRFTSASIKSEKALPPQNKDVISASFMAHNSQVTKAVRAFEKHSERTNNSFWGKVVGNPRAKEEKVSILIHHILENKTWWNVFYHYKHELVYEIRISSGHGIRWKKSNLEFIGFVEPFLD